MTAPTTLTARGESAFTGLIVAGVFLSAALILAAVVGVFQLIAMFAAWLLQVRP